MEIAYLVIGLIWMAIAFLLLIKESVQAKDSLADSKAKLRQYWQVIMQKEARITELKDKLSGMKEINADRRADRTYYQGRAELAEHKLESCREELATCKKQLEDALDKAKDYELISEYVHECLETIASQEELIRLKDEEIEALEKRGGIVEEATVDSCLRRNDGRVENGGEGAAGLDKLMPRAHRALLLDEIQDHKNTKMLLELATAANLELKLQVEELEAELRAMKGYEVGGDDVLDSEIQAMEDLRQDVYISEPGTAATDGRALDSVEEPEVAV